MFMERVVPGFEFMANGYPVAVASKPKLPDGTLVAGLPTAVDGYGRTVAVTNGRSGNDAPAGWSKMRDLDEPTPRGVTVFAPGLYLEVSFDNDHQGHSDVHVRPGGQAYWIARMTAKLGARTDLCCALGGERGALVRALLQVESINHKGVERSAATPVIVEDRRGDEPCEVLRTAPIELDQRDLDELHSAALASGLQNAAVVLTGNGASGYVPASVIGRLAADLRNNGVLVVGDLHGDELDSVLASGGLDMLKVSTDDIIADGRIAQADHQSVIEFVSAVTKDGADNVIVSNAGAPTIAFLGGSWYHAANPVLEVVEHRGSGDSMTAALAVGLIDGMSWPDLLRLACASGGANVTREGLASGALELIEALVAQVQVIDHGTHPPAATPAEPGDRS